MSVIDVHRPHALDKEHAREAAESLAKDLSSQFDVHYQWEGDHLKFKRSGVKGHLNITPTDLHSFLHRGYSAFRKMDDVELLIDRLVSREQRVMRNILDHHPDPFSLPENL